MLDIVEARERALGHGFFGTDQVVAEFIVENGREPKKHNDKFVEAEYLGNYEEKYVFKDKFIEDFTLKNPPIIGIPYYVLVDKKTGDVSTMSISDLKKEDILAQ